MAESAPTPGWDGDALRALEARLDQAAAAAERLLGEAGLGSQDSAEGRDRGRSERGEGCGERRDTPAGGWQRPAQDAGRGERFGGWLDPADGELLLALLTGLRDRIPVDLQRRLVAALHEVVLALRALIEWCAQRAERRRAAPVAVQDIPIL